MQRLLWVDVETTGLDPENGFLLEVALVVTDEHLEPEGDICLQLRLPEDDMTFDNVDMHENVREMHTKSGLLEESKIGMGINTAQGLLKTFVEMQNATNLCIAGSNPSFDRKWLEVHMPELAALFHYRSFDMNTLYYFFDIVQEVKDATGVVRKHRAIDDITLDISIAQSIVHLLDARSRVKFGVLRQRG
jgi:oligoribonuclease